MKRREWPCPENQTGLLSLTTTPRSAAHLEDSLETARYSLSGPVILADTPP